MQHHEDALARFVRASEQDPDRLGVLLTGSVARGEERADSDVDIVLVVSEESWHDAVRTQRVMWVETEGADYDGGYFDVKLGTPAMLEAAPELADEAAISTLMTARVAYDRGCGLEGLIAAIRRRADAPRPDLARSFLAQARIQGGWFLAEGVRRDDPLLTGHAAVHLATAAARALLAVAGVPCPGPKQLVETLRALPTAPRGAADAVVDVVARPGTASARVLLDLLEGAAGHLLDPDLDLSTFVLDNEYAWFTGRPAPEFR